MADPADNHDETHDDTGHASDAGVEASGNDAFGAAFEAFASGNKPDPEVDDQHDGDDAGQSGADDGGDKPPAEGASDSPPADAPGDKPAAGNTDPDPWATATPAQKAALQKMRDEYERKVQGASGRASGLQRELNALKGTAGTQPAKPQEQGKKPSDAWTALDDKIKGLKEDYPEIADVLVPLLEAQRDELASINGRMAPVIAANEQDFIAGQQQALTEKHPDWAAFAPGKNPAFEGWLNSQPAGVQRLAGSDEAQEVAVALTLFKTERAEAIRNGQGGGGADPKPRDTATEARRARQLDGGKQVGSRPGGVATGAPDDFDGAFDHFAKRQAAANAR